MKPGTFHERPLVVFSALAIVGAGLLTVPLVARAAGHPDVGGRLFSISGVGLLAVGVAVSLLHLGRPWLAPLSLRRVGRSRLSSEVAAAALVAAAAALTVVAGGAHVLSVATGLLALGFLVALGLVYNLAGQRTWRGPIVVTPALMGLLVGALALATAAEGRGITTAVLSLLAVDAAVFAGHWLVAGKPGGLPNTSTLKRSLPHTSTWEWLPAALLGARLALANLLAGGLVVVNRPGAALIFLVLGILADRLAFYLLAAPHTTEAEIARIEALMQ
jgi:anaerobic dimethyl sulfoxide reductase subunit C (anchor subunit)